MRSIRQSDPARRLQRVVPRGAHTSLKLPAALQQRDDGKQPYRFRRKDLEPFAFAGLWEFARLGGEEILSAAMIVGEPNPLVGGVHDRMPVMLMPEDPGERHFFQKGVRCIFSDRAPLPRVPVCYLFAKRIFGCRVISLSL